MLAARATAGSRVQIESHEEYHEAHSVFPDEEYIESHEEAAEASDDIEELKNCLYNLELLLTFSISRHAYLPEYLPAIPH